MKIGLSLKIKFGVVALVALVFLSRQSACASGEDYPFIFISALKPCDLASDEAKAVRSGTRCALRVLLFEPNIPKGSLFHLEYRSATRAGRWHSFATQRRSGGGSRGEIVRLSVVEDRNYRVVAYSSRQSGTARLPFVSEPISIFTR